MTPRTTSSIILSIILGTTTLLGVFFTLISFAHAQSQSNCHLITGSNQTPTGYASPISYFSNALMIKGDCDGSSIATQVGNGSTNTFIYNTSYRWSGTAWQTVALSGSQTQGAWIQGSAQAQFTSNRDTTFYVAYTCEWVNQAWKCGCLNASCTQNQWQLQVFQRPAAPPPTNTGGTGNTGGTTAGWQSFPNDSQQTLSHTQPLNSFNGANPQNLVDTYMDGRDNDVNNPGGGVNLNSAKLASSNQSSQFYPDATLATLGFKEAIKVNRNGSELTASYDGHTIGRYTSGGWNVNYPESLSNKPSGELGEATVKMLLKSNFRNQGSGWQYYATGGTSGEQGGGAGYDADDYPWSQSDQPGGPSTIPSAVRTINVSSNSQLSSALSNAQAGDHIVVANGNYSGFTVSKNGTRARPIVVRAANVSSAKVSGTIALSGNNVILQGFEVRNGNIRTTGTYNRVTRNRVFGFTQRGAIIVGEGADYTRLDRNEIADYHIQGIWLITNDLNGPKYVWIDHNYVRDKVVDGGGNNLEEAIQIGEGGAIKDVKLYAVVENNLITNNPDTDDAISIKSSNNIVRGNTLLGVKHGIVFRAGNNNTAISNYVRANLRSYDLNGNSEGHTFIGNDGNIRIGGSEVSDTSRDASKNWLLAGNKGNVDIGAVFSNSKPPFKTIENIRIEAQQGNVSGTERSYVRNVTQVNSTNQTWSQARQLKSSDVGPMSN